MRTVLALVFLVGCGGGAAQQLTVVPPDLAEVVVQPPVVDGAMVTVDMDAVIDASQSVDMAHMVVADMAQSIPDMTQPPPPPDMAQCDTVPKCLTGGAPSCCNGAGSCINYNCISTAGQYCNTDDNSKPLVLCYMAHPCGTDHKCT